MVAYSIIQIHYASCQVADFQCNVQKFNYIEVGSIYFSSFNLTINMKLWFKIWHHMKYFF